MIFVLIVNLVWSLGEVNVRRELIRVDWDHILYDYGKDRLLLMVSCGRSGVFSVNLFLTPTERKKYHVEGAEYISLLASRVRFSPSKYDKRHAAAEKKMSQLRD